MYLPVGFLYVKDLNNSTPSLLL